MGTRLNETEARNRRILELLASGLPVRDVSRRFGLSRPAVYAIIRNAERKKMDVVRGRGLRCEIPLADDLDRKWSIEDLLAAFLMPVRADNMLRSMRISVKAASYSRAMSGLKVRRRMSLREFMNLLVHPSPLTARCVIEAYPLSAWRGLGGSSIRATLDAISTFDMGPKCNVEWRRRMKELRKRFYR